MRTSTERPGVQGAGALDAVPRGSTGRGLRLVGRFVGRQQVGFGADEQRRRQPRFLPAGEGRDGARCHVAAKIEAAQIVAQFLLRRQRFQPLKMLQGRFVLAQLFQLVLGEVADVQCFRFLALTTLLRDGRGQ